MLKLLTQTRKLFIVILATAVLNIPVAAVFADDSCTPPSANGNGVHAPTGSDASTFVYQCDGQYAGDYTNQYYVYLPATGERIPLYDPAYSYDCTTSKWTMLWWSYSPAMNGFYSSRLAADVVPSQPTGCPAVSAADATNPSNGSASGSGSTGGQGINGTGPGSTNSINNSVGLNGTYTNNTGLGLNNGLYSQASTGNTNVNGNTLGGSALSGDATSVTNVANLLQSTSNVFGPNLTTFTANINGDVNGDFMFDPSASLANTGPNSNNDVNNKLQVNTNNTNNTNAHINNTIDTGAASGNASVANNTAGGDAKSGNAEAVVNLANLINSTVASGKSFLGTINVNGNLNGDILLPAGFVNQLLAATGPNSTNSANTNLSDNDTTTNNTNESVNNTIKSTTQTGTASVAGNTAGGSATSGNAGTNTTLLNLTGSSVVGKNDLLVFVNVLGHWTGMIVNAPAGSTAASLGGGILSNVGNTGPGSSNATNTDVSNNSTTTNNTNLGINNNVNVHAQSGDAGVSGNTQGGSAKSGDAHTAVNVLNLMGSNINVSDWFGVLFINVFGNWNGSFGMNTSAGDSVAAAAAAANSGATSASFQFIPANPVTTAGAAPTTTTSVPVPTNGAASNTNSAVLAAKVAQTAAKTNANLSISQKAANHLTLPILGTVLAVIILLTGERNRFLRRNH